MFLPNCRYRNVIKAIIVAVVIATLIGLILYVREYTKKQNSKYEETNATDVYRELNTVLIGDEKFTPKTGLKTVLVVGLDIDGKIKSTNSYNNDYNADFIMLATFDIDNKLCNLVEINRDSVVPVQRLDIFGREIDKQPMQVCLSYSYGDGLTASAKNTRQAISDMFYGLNIDYYIVVSRDASRLAVDYLDGIDVFMDDDYVDVNESYTKGSIHHMDADEAMDFVSVRQSTLNATNTYRMQRQMCLINSLVQSMQNSTTDYVGLYNSFMEYSITDVDFSVFSRILGGLSEYSVAQVETPSGYSEVQFGHNEFYMDEKSVKEIAQKVFYDKI